MKALLKMLLTPALLLTFFSCQQETAEPACIQGVVIADQGCPNAILIQVLNKSGVGQSVRIVHADNTVTQYENVVKTPHPFTESFASLNGRTIYFRYTLPSRETLSDLDKPAPCQAIYVNYDVPYITLLEYSWEGCPLK